MYVILRVRYVICDVRWLALTTNNKNLLHIVNKIKDFLYRLTVGFFWFVIIYIIYLLILSIFNIKIATANIVLYVLTVIASLFIVLLLFKKPRNIIEKVITTIFRKIE